MGFRRCPFPIVQIAGVNDRACGIGTEPGCRRQEGSVMAEATGAGETRRCTGPEGTRKPELFFSTSAPDFSRSSTDTETTLMLSSANLSAALAKAASWSLQNGHQEPRWNRITPNPPRSEEHTSELQSLMRNSYAVFCLKKKKTLYRHALSHTSNTTAHEK